MIFAFILIISLCYCMLILLSPASSNSLINHTNPILVKRYSLLDGMRFWKQLHNTISLLSPLPRKCWSARYLNAGYLYFLSICLRVRDLSANAKITNCLKTETILNMWKILLDRCRRLVYLSIQFLGYCPKIRNMSSFTPWVYNISKNN